MAAWSRRAALAVLAALAAPAAAQDRLLIGVWRGRLATVTGPMDYELVLQADGTYSALGVVVGSLTRHWGRWRVLGNVLRLDLQGAEPRQWCGPLGCSPIRWPESESWPIDMPDPDTLRTQTGYLRRVR